MNKFINLITRISLTNSSKFFKVDVKKQPKMRLRSIVPIFPPPGYNLKLPEWTPETFLWKIGNNCKEHADKFENLAEIFSSNRIALKKKGIKARQRKHILEMIEQLRRGTMTFEYLQRRTVLEIPDKE